ncbi:MAG: hypothetical protein ACRDZO_05595 [Egibacteraceae bacterium]
MPAATARLAVHQIIGYRSTGPAALAQPCKDCRDAKVAESLVTDVLKICERARLGSAVMLATDLLDVLNDPDEASQNDLDEVSQAGRNPLASPEGPAGSGHGG